MIYPHNVIEEVRMNNDIAEVIGETVKLKMQSGRYVGLCPFHHEKTPSFHVNVQGQYFYCFGCGEKGDVISFIMKTRGYDFTDALKFLAERIHYTLPEAENGEEYKKTAEERQTLYEMNKKTARFYYERLSDNEGFAARRYLDNRRVSLKTRTIYGLGYAPFKKNSAVDFLRKEGYSDDMILKSGLGTQGKNGELRDKFFGRLMFPIIDIHGRIIGFGGRTLDDGKPKYLNSPETPVFNKSSNLYSMNFALREKKREFILVEGYMDVISLYQAGFRNAVAALGTGFNENHTKLLKKYADSVIVLFDSDEAGVKAVLRALPFLVESGISPKVLQVTNAKDPDEYIKKFGSESFGELLKTAVPHIEFRLELEKKGLDMERLEDKVKYTKSAAGIISSIDNEMERDIYAARLAEETGVSPEAVKTEISKKKSDDEYENKRNTPLMSQKTEKSGLESAKKGIINIISYYPYVYKKISKVFKPSYLNDSFLEGLLNIIIDNNINKDLPVYPAEIINYYEDEKDRNSVMEILAKPNEANGKAMLEKNLNDFIKIIMNSYYSEKIKKEKDLSGVRGLMELKKNIGKFKVVL